MPWSGMGVGHACRAHAHSPSPCTLTALPALIQQIWVPRDTQPLMKRTSGSGMEVFLPKVPAHQALRWSISCTGEWTRRIIELPGVTLLTQHTTLHQLPRKIDPDSLLKQSLKENKMWHNVLCVSISSSVAQSLWAGGFCFVTSFQLEEVTHLFTNEF